MSEYRDLYNKTWSHAEYHEHSPELSAVDRIAELARSKGLKRILALGCGQGKAVKRLVEMGFDAYGLDASDVALSASPELKDRVRCQDISKLDGQPFGPMDLCYSVDVLEHVHPEHLHGFFSAIQKQEPKWVYLEISTNEDYFGPVLAGEPLHVCVRSMEWWKQLVGQYFEVCESHQGRDSFVGGCAITARKGCGNAGVRETVGRLGEVQSLGIQRLAVNVDVLKKRYTGSEPEWLETVRNADPKAAGLTAAYTPEGLPFGAVRVGDGWLALDDHQHPRQDAQAWARQLNLRSEAPLVVLFGFGYGYVPEEILRLMGPRGRLIILEPYPEIMRAAMEARDLSQMLSDPRATFQLGFSQDDIKRVVGRVCTSNRMVDECHPVSRRSYAALLSDTLVQMATDATSTFDMVRCTRMTIQHAGAAWTQQALGNIVWASKRPGMEALCDVEGLNAAVVVGAGPTLPGALGFLNAIQDRVPILAADSAVPRLVDAGIHPHVVVAIDRKEAPMRSASRLDPSKTGLVTSEYVHPGYRDMEAAFKVTCLQHFWCSKLHPVGTRKTWSNMTFVGGTATEIARAMGARTIYLVGLDFAFAPDGSTHVAGALPKDLMDIHANSEWKFQLPGYTVPSLRTSHIFKVYLEEFCEYMDGYPELNLIPVTTGGARIGSLSHVLPADAMALCAAHPLCDWRYRLKEKVEAVGRLIPTEEQLRVLHDIVRRLERMILSVKAAPDIGAAVAVLREARFTDLAPLYWMTAQKVLDEAKAAGAFKPEHLQKLKDVVGEFLPAVEKVLEETRQ